MHELAVCQALVAQVEALARQRAARVRKVRVAVGPLSGVEAALLEQAYPFACAGGDAEGSTLDIAAAPVRVRCVTCGAESAATANRLLCGACGDWRTELVSGDELTLVTVELCTDV